VAYFTSYYTNYFDVGAAVVAQQGFYGGHFADPNKPFKHLEHFPAYDRKALRKQLEELLFPKIEIPGRVAVKQPPQPVTPVIETIRATQIMRKARPIYIPNADREVRRLFREDVKKIIRKRRKRRRDEAALLALLYQ